LTVSNTTAYDGRELITALKFYSTGPVVTTLSPFTLTLGKVTLDKELNTLHCFQ